MNPSDFERRVIFEPAYNRVDEGYGIHGMNMRMGIIGPLGAVVFTVFTNWHLRSVLQAPRPALTMTDVEMLFQPMGADVGCHWSTPMYEGQDDDYTHENCEWLGDGRFCWYDGSGLAASELMPKFIEQGDGIVWETLEGWYVHHAAADPSEFEAARAEAVELHREIQRPLKEAP